MAIFGPYSTVHAQTACDPRFAAAHHYVTELLNPHSSLHARVLRLAEGVTERVELTGGSFALEQVYPAKARSAGFFESHRKYIDVQVIVAGQELMEVEETDRLTVTTAYNPERDLLKYADTEVASLLRMRAGDVAIFFPTDGHMPSLYWHGSALVRKAVVKVPVAP